MFYSPLIGHAKERAMLAQMLQTRRAHAFFLYGVPHVGKTTLAELAAADVFGCRREELHRHPNVIFLSPDLDQKTDLPKTVIGVDVVERFSAALIQSAAGGGTKVGIIECADLLNVQAQNSLLKVVEDPRGDTIFFFVATDIARILPTLLSRTVAIAFGALSDAEREERLLLHPDSETDVDARNAIDAVVTSLLTGEKTARLLAAARLGKGDDAESRTELVDIATRAAEAVHTTFLEKCGTMSCDERRLYTTALMLLADAPTALHEYASPALVFEQIVLALP